jgi:riboflavin kinase / FMN adenylyltransferase
MMKVYYNLDEIGILKNPVVTTGIFDGVHVGHKAIINRLKKFASEINGETVIITFDPHPRTVLYPDTKGKNLKLICSGAEKIKLLNELGIDHLITIHFTKEFAETTSEHFVKEILVGKLNARKIVVGFNHHFGYLKSGNYATLKSIAEKLHFDVEEIPAQELENETISSTRIRNALLNGEIQRANAYLDHYFFVMSELKEGDKKFKQLGFPMYSLETDGNSKLVPPPGVYAVSANYNSSSLHGLVKVEKHKYDPATIDVNFFNAENIDLTGHTLSVNFHKRIRKNFLPGSLEKIKTRLETDRKKIEELIF